MHLITATGLGLPHPADPIWRVTFKSPLSPENVFSPPLAGLAKPWRWGACADAPLTDTNHPNENNQRTCSCRDSYSFIVLMLIFPLSVFTGMIRISGGERQPVLINTYIHVYVRTYTYTHIHWCFNTRTHTHTHIYIYIYIYIHVCVRVCLYVCVCVCV